MKAHHIAGNFVLAVGILLALASLGHYFVGYPDINQLIKSENVGAETARTFRIIWIFSSITMCLLSIWAIFLSKDVKAGQRRAWWQGLLLGAGLILFGSIGQTFGFPNFHLMGFSFIGLLAVVPLLAFYKSYH
jgi:hypothetical protein